MPIPQPLLDRIKLNRPDFIHLDLSDFGLNDRDMDTLQESMNDNFYITSIDLSRNNITSAGIGLVSLLLNKINKLNIRDNYVNDETIDCLFKNLASKLEWLNVGNNGLTDKSASLILQKIKNPHNALRFVDVSGNREISEERKEQIAKISGDNLLELQQKQRDSADDNKQGNPSLIASPFQGMKNMLHKLVSR